MILSYLVLYFTKKKIVIQNETTVKKRLVVYWILLWFVQERCWWNHALNVKKDHSVCYFNKPHSIIRLYNANNYKIINVWIMTNVMKFLNDSSVYFCKLRLLILLVNLYFPDDRYLSLIFLSYTKKRFLINESLFNR